MGAGKIWPMQSGHEDCGAACSVCGHPLEAGQLCVFILYPTRQVPQHMTCIIGGGPLGASPCSSLPTNGHAPHWPAR